MPPTIFTNCIGGAASRSCRVCGPWKEHWSGLNNRRFPIKCQLKLRRCVVNPNSDLRTFVGCNNDAEFGLHIRMLNRGRNQRFIVPGCPSCNRRGTRDNPIEFQLKDGARRVSAVQCIP